jgi:KipI family sensor histidine kinase inhibitor
MNDHVAFREEGPRISMLGTTGLVFEAPGAFDLGNQQRIWGMADALANWAEVREAVPGMTNLTILFEKPPHDVKSFGARLASLWESGISKTVAGRTVDLPIVYGGTGGPHLLEVAQLTGLSVDEVVSIHSAPVYTVYAVGSHAGYCYLGGLDPRLFVPRRAVPLMSIPAGSL